MPFTEIYIHRILSVIIHSIFSPLSLSNISDTQISDLDIPIPKFSPVTPQAFKVNKHAQLMTLNLKRESTKILHCMCSNQELIPSPEVEASVHNLKDLASVGWE